MNEPIHVELAVFESDDGWRWRLRAWVGNVDTRNTPPQKTLEAPTEFQSRRVCYLAGLARARVIAL